MVGRADGRAGGRAGGRGRTCALHDVVVRSLAPRPREDGDFFKGCGGEAVMVQSCKHKSNLVEHLDARAAFFSCKQRLHAQRTNMQQKSGVQGGGSRSSVSFPVSQKPETMVHKCY